MHIHTQSDITFPKVLGNLQKSKRKCVTQFVTTFPDGYMKFKRNISPSLPAAKVRAEPARSWYSRNSTPKGRAPSHC